MWKAPDKTEKITAKLSWIQWGSRTELGPVCGPGSTQCGSSPLSLHCRDRQTLAPRAPNLLCYLPQSVSPLLIAGCLPAATPPLTLHPLAYWYTSPQVRLRVLLGKAVGLQGGLIQSGLGPNTHIIHHQHRTSPEKHSTRPSFSLDDH